MKEPVDLDEIAKRPMKYWDEDGPTEIFVGLMMLVSVCLFRLEDALPKGSLLFDLAPLAWGAAMLALKRGLKELKERVVCPRGGYVALRESRKTARIGAVALLTVLVAAAGIAFPLTRMSGQWGGVPGMALAVLFAASFFFGGLKARLPHMLVLAAVPLVAGIWIYGNSVGLKESIFWLLLAQGGALACAGALRFMSFLKANPKVDAGL